MYIRRCDIVENIHEVILGGNIFFPIYFSFFVFPANIIAFPPLALIFGWLLRLGLSPSIFLLD